MRWRDALRQMRRDDRNIALFDPASLELQLRVGCKDRFFDEGDRMPARETRHEMMRPLQDDFPTEMGETQKRGAGRGRLCGGWKKLGQIRGFLCSRTVPSFR